MFASPPASAAPMVHPVRRDATDAPLAVSVSGTEGVDDPLARVAALINEGQARFDTADFTGAIELWTQAYAALPEDPAVAQGRDLLAYQIAQAHIEAHAMDGQPTHLRKAERLLSRYLEGLAPTETELRGATERLLADLRIQIAAAPPPVILPEAAAPSRSVIHAEPRRTPPLMIAGAVSLGLGGALLAGSVVAAIEGLRIDRDGERAVARGAESAELDDLRRRGERANDAALGTVIAGALLVTAGAAMLIAGRVRRSPVAAAPVAGPGFVGMSFGARF